MTSDTLIEVLDALIGKTLPTGNNTIDQVRFNNLKIKIDVVNTLLEDLYDSAEYRKSMEESVRENGETAYATMLELKNWLLNVEEELA